MSLLVLALSTLACSGNGAAAGSSDPGGDPGLRGEPFDASFFLTSTVSQRVALPLASGALDAPQLAQQLASYDPGSLLRCEIAGRAQYDAAINALGGVRWGYSVRVLEDLSKPKFMAGFPQVSHASAAPPLPGGASAGSFPSEDDTPPPSVEIAPSDIVAVTESSTLFYSAAHGLMLVDITGGQPRFKCATQLPGNVGQFFYDKGHLVVMTRGSGRSALLHFRVDGPQLSFVELVALEPVLDSRRFNDKLVFYTDLSLTRSPDLSLQTPGAAALAPITNPTGQHRALRVFRIGDTLREELNDTLLDTTEPQTQLISQVTPDTPVDTLVSESQRFGQSLWASDRYFVVTEVLSKTYLSMWNSSTYPVCTASHVVEIPYRYCTTQYETRPNPDYTPPDNSGGDRSCQGATLSACLSAVARVSNPTIQVPVGTHCEDGTNYQWVCDSYQQQTTSYPSFRTEDSTRLYIYEYTESGFVRVDTSVHEITTAGLESTSPDAQVAKLTTSAEAYDVAVSGAVQTLHFQNDFLYVISQGVLQVYAMGGGSMVRTSTLPVVSEKLQSSLFANNRLYLSDFGWSGGDHSTLRVVDLANPAFPSVEGSSHTLPGGHRSILASDHGIFTIGSVDQFQGRTIDAIKLGLFSDPFVDERAYLIAGTDLNPATLGDEKAQFFNSDPQQQRTLLPYSGFGELGQIARVGVSHIEPDRIVSEGAVVTPELAQRVRRLPGESESYLSFATSSIEWLTPKDAEWQSAPVLEYFQPIALYRLTEQDDYVEVQRLGERCRLFFANASNINQRADGGYSEPFSCSERGPFGAYANQILFALTGIEFDAATHELRVLDLAEAGATRSWMVYQRPTCFLSQAQVSDIRVDYNEVPDVEAMFCLTPVEYRNRLDELTSQQTTP